MKATDGDLNVSGSELPRDVAGSRELIGLHADETHQPLAIGGFNAPTDLLDRNDNIGFVINLYVDFHIVAKHPAIHRIEGQAIHTGKGVGRDPRAPPLNDITVVVIMRRFD